MCQHLDSAEEDFESEEFGYNEIQDTLNDTIVMPMLDSQIENMVTIEKSDPSGKEEVTLEPMTEVELKPLPKILKYEFLDEECKYNPVIISSELTRDQEEKLLVVLRRNKKALGWTISDLKGISPLICSHHIFLEEDAKPSREMQRRLNQNL